MCVFEPSRAEVAEAIAELQVRLFDSLMRYDRLSDKPQGEDAVTGVLGQISSLIREIAGDLDVK